jgi:molybdopterin molybdotransferase
LSTGDEIVRPGGPSRTDGTYDTNHFLLRSLLEGVGADVADLGILPDRLEEVVAALAEAAAGEDAIIATGGTSRGEEDHVVTAIDRLGKRHLWQIAVKPGRPMSLGQIGNTVFLGLPGNPVAVMVCFLIYARPLLLALSGATSREPRRFPVPADFEIPSRKTGRREFWRASLVECGDRLMVRKFPRDGSGLITSLREADGLIDVPEETAAVSRGDLVGFIPFAELGVT